MPGTAYNTPINSRSKYTYMYVGRIANCYSVQIPLVPIKRTNAGEQNGNQTSATSSTGETASSSGNTNRAAPQSTPTTQVPVIHTLHVYTAHVL